jgi:parallel beta-helix repeat protein
MRWSATSNTIYVTGAGVVCAPTQVSQFLTTLKTPPPGGNGLFAVTAGTWYLGSNLILQSGAELVIYGTAIGGDTDELRLRSLHTNNSDAITNLRADWGTIDIDTTRIISWNDAANGPDTGGSSSQRAYINVRSSLDPDGKTAHESRMNIRSSEVSFLGWGVPTNDSTGETSNGSESYGLSWKVIGNPTTPSGAWLYDLVHVYGDVLESNIHDNYFGIFTFGGQSMHFDHNEVHHNTKYGFDPHDDSDYLSITNNHSHDNGHHGIICSRRCDHLDIENNVSEKNAGVGIFLHGGDTDNLVANNNTLNNQDAGFALFDSHHNTIRNNVSRGDGYGVRATQGSSNNLVLSNEIAGSTSYSFYLFPGSLDPATYQDKDKTTGDTRPKLNQFLNNNIHDTASAIRLIGSDDDLFDSNTFTSATNAQLSFESGQRNRFQGNQLAFPQPLLQLVSMPSAPNLVYVSKEGAVSLLADTNSTAIVDDAGGQIYESQPAENTVVTPSGSQLTATAMRISVTPLPLFVSMSAAANTTATVTPADWNRLRQWAVSMQSADALTFRIGGLTANGCYRVVKGGATLGADKTAAVDGTIGFSDAPGGVSITYGVVSCP